jgi:diguanylate cyclase (GGDEF)-like protein
MFEKYSIFDMFLDGVIIFDEKKEIVYCNEIAAILFNQRVKRVIGKSLNENFVFHASQLFCSEGEEGKNSPSQIVECEFSSPKDASGTCQVFVQPELIYAPEKRWIIYFHNVTEEKSLSTKYRTEYQEKEKAQDVIFKIQDDLKEISDMAMKDEMTGLRNYRFFSKTIIEELNNAIKYELPLSLAIIDVDKFKKFNDTYGHQQGDEVLRHVARALSAAVRSSDIVCRYGGEEFVILFPRTPEEGLFRACEKVRIQIEETRVQYLAKHGEFLNVTASFGAVTLNPEVLKQMGNVDPKIFIEEADKNLYKAKEGGRNQCVVSKFIFSKT